MELLKLQVKIALQRALQPGDLSPSGLKAIMTGLQNEWIEQVRIFGLNRQGYARCELALRIDWRMHRVHINAGRITVEIDSRWTNDTSLELHNYLELFNEFVRNNGLRTEWEVAYGAHLNGDAVNAALGLVRPAPVRWAGGREGTTNIIPEIDETSVGFWMVI
jgi:hypothetical protein